MRVSLLILFIALFSNKCTSQDGGSCTTESDCETELEFCGNDSQCHFYSCRDWYDFGPTDFTGNDNTVSLSCQDTSSGSEESQLVGVSFRCSDEDPTPIRAIFNRKCTAPMPEKSRSFDCLEYAQNTDFSSFVNEAESSGLTCQNQAEDPFYDFSVSVASPGVMVFRGPDGQTVFDGALARRTIDAALLDVEFTESPTAAPTRIPTATPTDALPGTPGPSLSMTPGPSPSETPGPSPSSRGTMRRPSIHVVLLLSATSSIASLVSLAPL